MTDLENFVKDLNGKVAIFTHGTPPPDPDAIGSARGLQWLLKKKFDVAADIFHAGDVAKGQNSTMINLLNIKLNSAKIYLEKKENYKKTIVVDATPRNIGVDVQINAIIDHHDVTVKEADFDFVYIRHAGSCSSLIYDIIKEQGVKFSPDEEEDVEVATALFFGLKNDSKNLTSKDTDSEDFNIYRDLSIIADQAKVTKIENYKKPKYYYQLRAEVSREENYVLTNMTYVGCLGCIPSSQRIAVPIIADDMIEMEGVNTSIVFAVIDDEIVVSIRNDDLSLQMSNFCQKLFGQGIGGKGNVYGGTIPLGFLSCGPNVSDEIKGKVCAAIKAKMMHIVDQEVRNET